MKVVLLKRCRFSDDNETRDDDDDVVTEPNFALSVVINSVVLSPISISISISITPTTSAEYEYYYNTYQRERERERKADRSSLLYRNVNTISSRPPNKERVVVLCRFELFILFFPSLEKKSKTLNI